MRLTISRNCTPGERDDYKEPPEGGFQNITYPFDRHRPALEVGLKTAFYIPSILLALVGNCLVLVVIAKSRRMHTATYCYIANLAVSDLLVGGFNTWVHLGSSITTDWPFGSGICETSIFFRTLAIVASAVLLTVIAGERFFSIVFPLKVRFTKRYIHGIIITICWLLAVAVALPTAFTRRLFEIKWRNYHQKFCAEVWPRYIIGNDPQEPLVCLYSFPSRELYFILQVTIMYGVPVVTMTTAYSVIYYTMHKRRAPGVQTDVVVAIHNRTKRKVLRMLVIIFGVFVVCYTPQEVLTLYRVLRPDDADRIPSWVGFMTVYLVYLNSALNPVLYGGLNENFRLGLYEVCRCKRSNRISPVGDGQAHFHASGHAIETVSTRVTPKKLIPRPNTDNELAVTARISGKQQP